MEKEVWKSIPNYEGLYEVSNLGRVKSLNYNKKGIEKILSFCIGNNGYYMVALCSNKKCKSRTIHSLVAEAFLNHKPCGHKLVIDHINNNKLDNRIENLQIVTIRYNTRKVQGNDTSKYKGVCWAKDRSKWKSCIRINYKLKNIGYFDNEYEAHLAYQNELNKI